MASDTAIVTTRALSSLPATTKPAEDETTEEAINPFLPEIVQRILFLANEYHNTRLVCSYWNINSLEACKGLTREDFEIFIGLIDSNLGPKKSSVVSQACRQVKKALKSLMPRVTTHAEAKRMVMITKGYIVGIFRKLAAEQREQLEQKIGRSIPVQHRDLFGLARVTLKDAINGNDFEKFFLIFHSYIPFKKVTFEEGLNCAALIGNNQMLRVMVFPERLSSDQAEDAIDSAITGNHLSSVELLLDRASLSEDARGYLVKTIARESTNLKLLQLLLSDGPISEKHRGKAVILSSQRNQPVFVQALLAHGPISDEKRGDAIQAAMKNDSFDVRELLLLPAENDGCSLL